MPKRSYFKYFFNDTPVPRSTIHNWKKRQRDLTEEVNLSNYEIRECDSNDLKDDLNVSIENDNLILRDEDDTHDDLNSTIKQLFNTDNDVFCQTDLYAAFL